MIPQMHMSKYWQADQLEGKQAGRPARGGQAVGKRSCTLADLDLQAQPSADCKL